MLELLGAHMIGVFLGLWLIYKAWNQQSYWRGSLAAACTTVLLCVFLAFPPGSDPKPVQLDQSLVVLFNLAWIALMVDAMLRLTAWIADRSSSSTNKPD